MQTASSRQSKQSKWQRESFNRKRGEKGKEKTRASWKEGEVRKWSDSLLFKKVCYKV